LGRNLLNFEKEVSGVKEPKTIFFLFLDDLNKENEMKR
jgi:hypothetical protein